MTYSDNLYLKRIAEKLTNPIKGDHTNNYYLKIISKNVSKGGGGGGYDDTEIKRRMTAVENGKQDKLTAGTRIILNGNEINTVEFINDSIASATNTWSANKIKGLFDSLSGKIEVRIVSAKPENPTNSTMYYVGSTAPYDIWFYVNDEYTYFGTTDIDLSNYYTKTEVDDLLDNKVDKVTGKSLVLDTDIAQITTNKNDIANLDSEKVDKEVGKSLVSDTDIEQITTNKTDIADLKDGENIDSFGDVETALDGKQDKITDSTLSTLADSTTVSSVSAASKTNKTFALSKLWEYILGKIGSSVGRGINVSSNVIGHSNSAITAKTNTNICGLKYDSYGHVTAKGTDYSVSDTYTSTADNQLFTRKGAYNLHNSVVRLGGVFHRNGTQSVSTANWTNIQLTATESGDSSIAELSSGGVKIKNTGMYRFTIVVRVPDTTSTLQWGVGITGSDDDLRGGSWNYTHTRHKVTTVIVKPISANTVIYPRINIISGASSINYCQMTVERIK
ncbi:MAG: hypothetical protein IKF11_10820 [Methanobrevibacter sp.]|nr:hypothetical protein [Methanobrevibacter sp.]